MKRFGLLISVLMLAVALSIYVVLRLSLPLTEGEISLQKLTNTVVVERDSLGVPTVRGSDRLDVARATGFLHAQDRFFQMDLMRRAAAGELSELLGASNVEFDKRRRIHRMRSVAQKALARSSASERAMMQAYAEGVNAGVQALTVRPFEYLILRTQPERWLPEDTILVAHSMFFRLNDSDASHDASYGRLHEALPEELYRFVTAPGSDWDAPLVGNAMKTPPIPGPAVCDLRSGIVVPDTKALFLPSSFFTEAPAAGSNSWAVAGKRSATGKAIVANDMHLGLDVPNVWYRMRLIVETPAPEEDQVNVTGVTLPGIPVVIAGSNGSLAWGFTNSFGDWSDLVLLEIDPKNASAYRTPNGFRPFDVYTEIIQIAGGEPIRLTVRSTIWGPVIGEDYRGRLRALRWLAHEPEALNLRLAKFERAVSVNEAVSLAPTIGVPPQNLMLADTDGNIGWTIIGRIPRRVGYDPKLPAYWSESETGWKGWVAPHDYPAVINPDSGYVWTANARVVEGELLALIGDGGYLLGARASQIRDALAKLEAATLDNMLAIQLDDRSRLHE
ncbi:MAG: penicillin acylase family protein, partial [Gammaproteobacteria bacterium]